MNTSPLRAGRALEIACGLIPFVFLGLLGVASRFWLPVAAAIVLVYALGWLVRLCGFAYRMLGAFYHYRRAAATDWQAKLAALASETLPTGIDPSRLRHAVIITAYNEPAAVLEATIKAVAASEYDRSRIMLILAYEARGGAAMERGVQRLIRSYGSQFGLAQAVKHPANLPGEAKAKAGNITYAARWLSGYCREQHIPADQVLVTTLDADNRPHPCYLAALAWTYAITPHRTHRAYQPLPLYTNNIWDAPAPVRVVATDTSLWFMMESMRPRRLRLFSAYAQSLQTLEEVGYWNVRTIVEDGHQYWRSYFAFHGDFRAVPLWLPMYQDAVVAGPYWQTLRAQFRQLLRWAWGVSDTPYVVREALGDRRISWRDKLLHIYRQMDDYLTWATAPIILAVGGWLPWFLSPRPGELTLAQLMIHVFSVMQLLALACLLVVIAVYVALLPPRPARYGNWRGAMMVLQWALEPITLVLFFSLASLTAHARLVLGKPLERFDVTIKTIRPDS
ncbi:MAG TPA: glycosyltransferase [Candidatus Saccharimonadales bacterium]|nr:glycosyltransferase [Candidatus Saccharimonadales bacterium]